MPIGLRFTMLLGLGLLSFGPIGCGLSNSLLGINHALYSNEVARCWYCADNDQVCNQFLGGGQCVAPSELSSCEIASGAGGRDADGPLIFPVRDATYAPALVDGCAAGLDELVTDIALLDRYDDVSLTADWDGMSGAFDLANDVVMASASEQAEVRQWRVETNIGDDGRLVYDVRIHFCVIDEEQTEFALYVFDERGNQSNVICLTREDQNAEE